MLIICHVIHREDERVEQRNVQTLRNEEPWRAPIIYNISKCGSHFRQAGEVLTDAIAAAGASGHPAPTEGEVLRGKTIITSP